MSVKGHPGEYVLTCDTCRKRTRLLTPLVSEGLGLASRSGWRSTGRTTDACPTCAKLPPKAAKRPSRAKAKG